MVSGLSAKRRAQVLALPPGSRKMAVLQRVCERVEGCALVTWESSGAEEWLVLLMFCTRISLCYP